MDTQGESPSCIDYPRRVRPARLIIKVQVSRVLLLHKAEHHSSTDDKHNLVADNATVGDNKSNGTAPSVGEGSDGPYFYMYELDKEFWWRWPNFLNIPVNHEYR